MDDFLKRLENEKADLSERIGKLGDFLNSDKFEAISKTQKHLLQIQFSAMKTYYECLVQRLTDLYS